MFDTRKKLVFFACLNDAAGAALKSAAPAPAPTSKKIGSGSATLIFRACFYEASKSFITVLKLDGSCFVGPIIFFFRFLNIHTESLAIKSLQRDLRVYTHFKKF